MTTFTSTGACSGAGNVMVREKAPDWINRIVPASPELTISFDWTPQSVALSVTIGATTYVPGFNHTLINTLITFTASVHSSSATRYPVAYNWEMGDGTKLTGEIVSHTYKMQNLQARVILRVTDNLGKLHTVNKPLYLTS